LNDELSTNKTTLKTTLNKKNKNKMMEIKDMPRKSTLLINKDNGLNDKNKQK